MATEEQHAMSGAYALDALDDLERARFERHLAECPACLEEVAGFVETAALLGAAAPSAPPVGLRTRVLADITKVRPLPPTTVPAQRRPDEHVAARRTTPRHASKRRFAPLAAVAAAVILAAGVVTGIARPWQDNGSQVQPAAAISQVIDATDAVKSQPQALGQGSATVIRSASVGRAVVVVSAVKAPSDKVYELWLLHGRKAVSAGFLSDKSDQTQLLKGDAATADAAAISVEPTGGSATPSGEPVVFTFGSTT